MWGAGWRGQWPGAPRTNDGTIPYKLFLFLIGTLKVLQAGRQSEMVDALTIGIANAFAGKEDKTVAGAVNAIRKAAFPVRYD